MDEKRKPLSTYLCAIRDPRRRQGRIYPLTSILTMLILAAVNGESTLRGMWLWAQQHWEQICRGLGLEWLAHPPTYGTLWRILALLEMSQLEPALRHWVQGAWGEAVSVDGKSLRGSRRRAGLPALSVVLAAAQGIRLILSRAEVEGEKVTEAALRLIQGMPLEGKVVTLDAGLNQRPIAKAIVEKGGPTWEW
jgi:hypothetical protein